MDNSVIIEIKKFVTFILCAVLIVGVCVTLAGRIPLTDENGNPVSLRSVNGRQAIELAGEVQKPYNIKLYAGLKGSIYETGENISLFGTCLDGYDHPVNGTFAMLQTWYPNGSQQLLTGMSMIQQGYFVYNGPMDVVQGTYLTEMDCYLPTNSNQSNPDARAWGEWQNPVWVRRLADLNLSLSGLNVSVDFSSVLGAIGNLSSQMNESFNITWDRMTQMNATLANLTVLITEVGQIANSSVDRNDSLIARLLLNLTRCLSCMNTSGQPLAHSESRDSVVYWSDWSITVTAIDNSSNSIVSYPDSYCQISTTLSPVATFMTVAGTGFTYTEFIQAPGDFLWTVNCFRS